MFKRGDIVVPRTNYLLLRCYSGEWRNIMKRVALPVLKQGSNYYAMGRRVGVKGKYGQVDTARRRLVEDKKYKDRP